MLRLALYVVLLSNIALGQAPLAENTKKDIVSLQNAVNEASSSVVPGFGVLQVAKATYLDGYGVVVNMELALEPPRNPFSGLKTPAEIRTIVTQRRKEVTDRLSSLLKEKVPLLESIGPSESVAIIVHLLNTNPADLPDLPSQLVLSVKKQDAATTRISIREFK